jgi:hypothetical protein
MDSVNEIINSAAKKGNQVISDIYDGLKIKPKMLKKV